MSGYGKVDLTPVWHEWHPAPLAEQVVLVTTIGEGDEPHVAAKSRVGVVSYGPPAFVFFACNAEFATAANLLATGEFVINVPSDDLVAVSWVIGSDPSGRGVERFVENGLTRIPAIAVRPPRIAECRAHVECRVAGTNRFGPDLAVFGEVVSMSIDGHLAQGDEVARYRGLAPFFFLDMEWTGSLGAVRRVAEPVPGPRHDLTILVTADMERARSFYERAFDWPVRLGEDSYVEFELPDGRGLALCAAESFFRHAGGEPTHRAEGDLSNVGVYLRCDDVRREISRLERAGARKLSDLEIGEWGDEAAYFADPDGHVLVLARSLRTSQVPDSRLAR